MNALAYIDSKIWAILPTELDKLRSALLSKDADFSKLAQNRDLVQSASADASSGGLRNGTVSESGIAVIDVKGPLFNVEGYFDEILAFYFGGTSIQSLQKDIDAVANNPAVESVVIKFHSPGGEVFGINETANKIADLSAKKPTIAFVYGCCASAAYFLAAKCTEIVTDAQAWIGSIGVVRTWADFTGFYEMNGVAFEEVTSENAPYKRLDIRIPEERAIFMDEINGLESIFIKSVAKGRGVPVDTVKSQFGAGAVMAGHLAVKAGMADRVGSFDEVIKGLRSNRRKQVNTSASADETGEIDMSLKDKVRELAASVGFKVEESEQAEPETEETETVDTEETESTEEGTEKPEASLKLIVDVDAESATAKLAAVMEKLYSTEAEAFAESEMKAGRMAPAEKESFTSLYIQAARDDHDSPLAEGSRVETLKANQQKRPALGFTREQVNADHNSLFILGLGGSEKTEMQKAAEAQVDTYVSTVNPSAKKLEVVKG